MNIEIPASEVFRKPTVKKMAEYITGREQHAFTRITRLPEQEYYAVSSVQKRLYILHKMEENTTNYNVPEVVVIDGSLDTERVTAIINQLILRHEALRTSFDMIDGEIVQKIHAAAAVQVSFRDLSSTGQQEAEIGKIIGDFIRPFNLQQAPLLRAGLIRTGTAQHILMFDMHHIVADGTSMAVLIRDFADLYNGNALQELTIQYRDFTSWQNAQFKQETFEKQAAWWLEKFAGEIPLLNLPCDYPRPAVKSLEGDRVFSGIGKELKTGIERIMQDTGATLNMVLLAAFSILLAKHSGQDDIIIGSPVAGRPHADLAPVVGMFVNTLALRSRPAAEKTFKAFLAEVKAEALAAYEHGDFPFEELVERLNAAGDRGRNPLFDVMFVQQNRSLAGREITGLNITPYRFTRKAIMFDLTLFAHDGEEAIGLEIEYSTRLFKRERIRKMAEQYVEILKMLTADPGMQIKNINPGADMKLLKKAAMNVSFNL